MQRAASPKSAAISSGRSRPHWTVTPGALPCSSCPSGVATLTVTSMPSAASWRESSRPSVVPLKTTTFIGGTPAA